MLASLFARRFWITTYVFLTLGFLLPGDYRGLSWSIPILLGGILYFSCLKIGLGEVAAGLRDPRLLARVTGLSLVKLLALPLAAWAVMMVLAPAWAPGVLLVGMMPAGMSSLAFADLYHGNRVVALMLTILTSLLCPLTVPLLLAWLVPGPAGDTGLVAMLAAKAGYITLLLLAPFALAQLTRALFPATIARHFSRWGYGSIVCVCVLVFVAVAANRDHWAGWSLAEVMTPLALMCLTTLVFALLALPFRFLLARGEQVSFACTAVYMNNGLGLALAVAFYHGDPHLLLPTVLIQFPMTGMVALIGWLLRPREAVAPV
jgi:BASS family bile acid:Na+ symporter